MKALVLAATVAAAFVAGGLSTSSADAAPYKKFGPKTHHSMVHKGKVSPHERAAIRHSKINLDRLKVRIHRDGRVTRLERVQLRNAEARHATLVKRAYR